MSDIENPASVEGAAFGRAFFEQSPFSTVIYDPEGHPIALNAAFEALWGVGMESVPDGYSVLEDEQLARAGALPAIRRAFAGETVITPPVRYDIGALTSGPGRALWTQGHFHPVRDVDGRLTHVVLTHIDLTEQKSAEEALRASERRFAAIIEQAGVGIVQANLEARIELANDRFARLMGRSREELPGVAITDLTHPEDRERSLELFRRGVERGESFEIEKRCVRPDGGIVWVRNSVSPLRDADGSVMAMLAIVVDVTEQRGAAARVRELLGESERAEAQFRMLADSIPQLAWMADASGWIFWYNRRWYDYTGTSIDTMQGWGWKAVHHPEHVDRVVERFRHSIETGEPWEDTFPLRARSGEYRWFLSRAQPIRDADGRIARWFGTNTDITEQRSAAAERERLLEAERAAREAAEQANRAKTQFLATMSHELRTPLNAIAGHAELIETGIHGPVTPAQLQALQRIRRSQRALLTLINDILGFARLEAGRLELDIRPVNVDDVLGQLEPLIEPQLAAKALQFQYTPPESPCTVRVDRERLQQIMLNLLSNAIKFTAPGGRIEVSVTALPTRVDIHVADTGIGIAPADQQRIFDPFVQPHRTLAHQVEGSGLGLAISRDLARAMGGEIGVASVVGSGATFTVTLPRDRG